MMPDSEQRIRRDVLAYVETECETRGGQVAERSQRHNTIDFEYNWLPPDGFPRIITVSRSHIAMISGEEDYSSLIRDAFDTCKRVAMM